MNPNRPRPSRRKTLLNFEELTDQVDPFNLPRQKPRSDFKRRQNLGDHDWLSKEEQEDMTAEMAHTA